MDFFQIMNSPYTPFPVPLKAGSSPSPLGEGRDGGFI